MARKQKTVEVEVIEEIPVADIEAVHRRGVEARGLRPGQHPRLPLDDLQQP
jgi:hypothetical protein